MPTELAGTPGPHRHAVSIVRLEATGDLLATVRIAGEDASRVYGAATPGLADVLERANRPTATDADRAEALAAILRALDPAPRFVLDLASNPHPDLRDGAFAARAAAAMDDRGHLATYWHGYRDAMAAATGLDPDAFDAWLDTAAGE